MDFCTGPNEIQIYIDSERGKRYVVIMLFCSDRDLLVKVNQSRYKPGVAQRVPGS